MTSTTRPQHYLDLGSLPPLIPNQPSSTKSSATTSPIERTIGNTSRSSQAVPGALSSLNSSSASLTGAGSPSLDYSGRLYAKSRARELHGSDKPSPSMWGPPTASGLSTPLRETIPESPGSDNFPELGGISTENTPFAPINTRSRAGTVPSRLPLTSGQHPLLSKTSRPSPTSSPFRPGSNLESEQSGYGGSMSTNAALLSRLRAGSTPQRSSLLSSSSPFGPSIFSSNWNSGRDRANSSHSMNATEEPTFPTLSISKDAHAMSNSDVKTLDYLGLEETPKLGRNLDSTYADNIMLGQRPVQPMLASLAAMNRSANRFRSYSVNAKEKYAADEDDDLDHPYYSGTLTPSAEAAAAAMAATQAQIHQHNLEVQAFANQSSSSRPRARTVGVLDSPSSRMWGSYRSTPSMIENQYGASDQDLHNDGDLDALNKAMRGTHLGNAAMNSVPGLDSINGHVVEETTRALWLGGIPASTTPSSLKVIFEPFGNIESARVLTYKSCGFVNFEKMESAARAKAQLNGKEIFPGAGPVRIGFARVPSATATPSNGLLVSPSPEPFAQPIGDTSASSIANGGRSGSYSNGLSAEISQFVVDVPQIQDLEADIMEVVKDLGATEEEQAIIKSNVEQAIRSDDFASEIPPISEPSPNRVHDAPRLREIRKRIDNNTCSQAEIEDIAMSMLPEISELSSDYLGNTVVQKLFEYCSENVKEAMLQEIAPHIAEIGVHKNGTWAAQKIIDVARSGLQMSMVVENLRPYGVASFLDQYGNYVMQCCLRFQAPYNNFIFETMLCRLWEVAQGRFGARAMRACLESHFATKEQQRMIAAAIALHCVQLATNTNGALLLTWFLDTCTFPHRRAVLAPRIVPHLVHLCTHKVAYLTVLKIINQRNEPEARDTILKALFLSPNDQTLEEILKDQVCGATLIFKVLTTPFFDDAMRPEVVQNIRKVLLKLKAQPSQGYKRLMDEVELSTRNQGAASRDTTQSSSDTPRSSTKQLTTPSTAQVPRQPSFDRQYSGQFAPTLPAQLQHNDSTPHRSAKMEATNSFDQYLQPNQNVPGQPLFPSGNMTSPTPLHPNQLQYQQAYFAAPRQPNGYNMPPAAMSGYPNSFGSQIDPYRGIPGNSMAPQMGINPMPISSSFNPQATYNPMMGMNSNMGGPAMWQQYPNMYMMPQHQQMQSQMMMGGGSVRRGRR